MKNWKNLTITTVVLGGIVLSLSIPTITSLIASNRQQRADLLSEAEKDHKRSTDILALSSSNGLWNYDNTSLNKIAESVMTDETVVSIHILDAKGTEVVAKKEEARQIGEILKFESNVLHEENVIGKVVIEFSLNKARVAIQAMTTRQIIYAAFQLIICISVLVALMQKRVISRLKKIHYEAEQLAEKKLDTAFIWTDGDEIGKLGNALEHTRVSIKSLFQQIEDKNKELAEINLGLEKVVQERTATIKIILDNVKNGFLVIGKDLKVQGGFSKSCLDLLQTTELEGKGLAEVLSKDERVKAMFDLNIEQVFEDILPEEVSLDQVPHRFKIGGKTLFVEGSTIRNAGKNDVEKILLSVTDITALEAAQEENKKNQALIRILRNIQAFREYISEFKTRIVAAAAAHDSGEERILRMQLHTLKGNSASFGLSDLVTLIHHIEELPKIGPADIEKCEAQLRVFLENNFAALKVQYEDTQEEEFMLSKLELLDLENRLKAMKTSGSNISPISSWLTQIKLVPASTLIGPMNEYVKTTSLRFDKKANLEIIGGDIRVDAKKFKPIFQNMTHLIRNSMDHGLELPFNRGSKNEVGTVKLEIKEDDKYLNIYFSDDGKGIDGQKVYEKAVAVGAAPANKKLSDKEKLNLIFADKVSTAETVNETSGRGVGMSSVKYAIEDVGGTIEVESKVGEYTRFHIKLPKTDHAEGTAHKFAS